jgi:putative oxidoreductase
MSANLNAASAYGTTYHPTYNQTLALVGRVLMALLFVYFGYMKASNFGGSVGYFTKWGFPAPQIMAGIAVLFELGFGVLLLIGWKTRWMALALAVYCIIATAVAHRFWTYEAAQAFNQTSHFFKNVSIIGGLLYIAAMGPGRYSVDKA